MEMMEAAVMKATSMKRVSAMEAVAAMLRVTSVCHTCQTSGSSEPSKRKPLIRGTLVHNLLISLLEYDRVGLTTRRRQNHPQGDERSCQYSSA